MNVPLIPSDLLKKSDKILFIAHLALGDYTYLQNCFEAFARAYWHWFFLIQPSPFPETLINATPDFYISKLMGLRHAGLQPFAPEAMAAYARPLTAADEEGAEELFNKALRGELSNWPFHRARLLLAHGRRMRRHRRLTESRPLLRAAMEAFDALGITSLGEEARAELRAAGEAVTRRAPESLDQLTPQELQIAKLAATGMTNREIGTRLFLSHRTVGFHLYRVFPKLGITSRGQLGTIDLGGD